MADANHKLCTCCGNDKPESEFYRRSSGTLRTQCKSCMSQKHAGYVARNTEAVAAYKRKWNAENSERVRAEKRVRYASTSEHAKERAAQYAKAHPDRVKTYKKKWKQGNPHKAREYRFVRCQTQKNSTPAWADRNAMLAIYRQARHLTKLSGVEHHVDHIVPLRSKNVCGLHCEQNMQILEASENISKLNRWWPDMWEPA